jgi:RNA polymerase sigma factor (sigma-70 family)
MKNPNKEELQELYNSGELIKMHQKMILAIAHRIHKRYPAESYDELVSEGYWGIVKGIPKYDSEKSTITTWLYQAAYYQMLSFCTNPVTHRDVPTPEEDSVFERAEEESWLGSFLRELSEDAEFLVGAVLEAPGELKNIVRESAPKSTQKRLRRYMQSEMQWDVERIERTWEEVKSWL